MTRFIAAVSYAFTSSRFLKLQNFKQCNYSIHHKSSYVVDPGNVSLLTATGNALQKPQKGEDSQNASMEVPTIPMAHSRSEALPRRIKMSMKNLGLDPQTTVHLGLKHS